MSSVATLTNQGFSQFKGEIFGRMLNEITNAVLETVATDRREEEIDADLLKKIVSIYSFLSTEKISGATTNCLMELENKMLEASRTFYSSKAQQMIETYSLVEYL